MYTQSFSVPDDSDTKPGAPKAAARAVPAEDAAHQARFDARIDADGRIEPRDWMPEAYRKTLVRQISQHAHSEIVGMLPEGNWIGRAPSLKRKAILLAKVQDEGGHGLYLYSAAETLGTSREDMLDGLHSGRAKYSSIFNYPTLSWADVGVIGWLVDGAAIMNQIPLCRCSYGPYARAMVRVYEKNPSTSARATSRCWCRCRARRRSATWCRTPVNRYWWKCLAIFGPPDADSPTAGRPCAGASSASNDDLRQKFVDATIAAGQVLGVTLPDPDLKWNEARGHYDYGAIDWDEFWQVVNGHGPMNKERLATRVKAHEDSAWVRGPPPRRRQASTTQPEKEAA
ncbi:MAG: 1,2-phenylacetyl-CoA epoxidase subunit PaaA [Ottowia sp.]